MHLSGKQKGRVYHRIIPIEKTSVSLVGGDPDKASGAIYPGVPAGPPRRAGASSPCTHKPSDMLNVNRCWGLWWGNIPKSATLTVQSLWTWKRIDKVRELYWVTSYQKVFGLKISVDETQLVQIGHPYPQQWVRVVELGGCERDKRYRDRHPQQTQCVWSNRECSSRPLCRPWLHHPNCLEPRVRLPDTTNPPSQSP